MLLYLSFLLCFLLVFPFVLATVVNISPPYAKLLCTELHVPHRVNQIAYLTNTDNLLVL